LPACGAQSLHALNATPLGSFERLSLGFLGGGHGNQGSEQSNAALSAAKKASASRRMLRKLPLPQRLLGPCPRCSYICPSTGDEWGGRRRKAMLKVLPSIFLAFLVPTSLPSRRDCSWG